VRPPTVVLTESRTGPDKPQVGGGGFRTRPDTGMMGRVKQEPALRWFCQQLAELRADAGGPTLRDLSRLPGAPSTSQLSDIFNGKIRKPPDRDVVRLIVTACLRHAQNRSLRGPRELGHWLARYDDLALRSEPAVRPVKPDGIFSAPIAEWNPFALGVHHAIAVAGLNSVPELPPYVVRRHDRQLRDKLAKPGVMAVLVGESSTGKTRAMLEAVRACLATRPVVHPPDAEALIEVTSAIRSPVVVWLNETQRYLDGPAGPAAAQALHSLLASGRVPIVVIGSMWLQYWEKFTAQPQFGVPDLHAHARELLYGLAERIDVPPSFEDLDAQRELKRRATSDSRLALANNTAKARRVIQVLAGGAELAHRYDHPTNPYSHAIVSAAIDIRRLGIQSLLPPALLRAAAPGYLTGEQRSAPIAQSDQWFDNALADALRPVHGIATLVPDRREEGMGAPAGYQLHDYLDQHGSVRRRPDPIPASTWSALQHHTTDKDELVGLVKQAADRALYRYAYSYFTSVTADRQPLTDTWDIVNFLQRSGREQEVASLGPEAATDYRWRGAGLRRAHGSAADEIRVIINTETRRVDAREDAEQPQDLTALVTFLVRKGKAGLIEPALRRAADSDHPQAYQHLAHWLASVGREAEAERVLREAFAANRKTACTQLVTWLTKVGRAAEAEDALRTAAANGDHEALYQLINLLKTTSRQGEVEQALRDAVTAGHTQAPGNLYALLAGSNRQAEAEEMLRSAILLGHKPSISRLVVHLRETGREDEAEQVRRFGLTPDGRTSPEW
jgi:tetratricopeptide (TPR) repeat protein